MVYWKSDMDHNNRIRLLIQHAGSDIGKPIHIYKINALQKQELLSKN